MKNINIYAFADEASSNFDEQIIALKRNNLNGVEIRNVDGTNISSISIDKAKEIKKKLENENLQVWSIGSPIGKINIHDDFKKHMDLLKHTLEISNILDCKNLRLFSFYIPNGDNPDDYSNEVLEKLSTMVELTIKYNVVPCHENEKEIFGDSSKRCLYLAQNIPNLKLVFDPANFIQCKQDVLDAWRSLKPFVKYLHIKDALENGNVVPSGYGLGHIKTIATDFITNIGNNMTIEPHLFTFNSLNTLERESNISSIGNMNFANANEAFDFAVKAFKNIIIFC